MGMLFLNAPVQNGEFTLTELPGKATGIRIAAALNQIMGAPPAPHLWNTATLTGDLRHREYTTECGQMSREDLDIRMIAAKYPVLPEAGAITDTDRLVAELAIRIIQRRLHSGGLRISRQTVRVCARCGHMTGMDGHPCKACGCADSRARTTRLLVADRDPVTPVLPIGRIHTPCRNPARHLRGIAGNTPARLILSRTRDHGIDLGPVGLPGLVLDPRAGLHTAALATARARQADIAVMAITANATANIAAYGQHFAEYDELRLLYALYGRVPYDQVTAFHASYADLGLGTTAQQAFETWFLPLLSLKEKNGVRAGQLPGLLRYFHRAHLAMPAEPDPTIVHALRQQIRDGDPAWVTHKTPLAAAMRMANDE
ncbi:MAG: hypothetical protein ACRDTA_28670 [Pseudonocardiaceae bacterium]